jgi:hypothetical protein
VNRRSLLGAALVLAIVVVVIAWRSSHAPPPAAASAPPATPASAPSNAPLPAGPRANLAAPPLAPYAPLGEPGLATDDPVTTYLRHNIYPPTSRPLLAEHLDLLRPNQRHETTRPTDADDGVTFLFTADRYFVIGDETITPVLTVIRDGAPVAFRVTQAFAAVLDPVAPADAPRYPFELGRAFAPSAIPGLARQTALGLFVEFAYAGTTQRARIDFQYTPAAGIPARFTGTFRDAIVDGSLVIRAGIEVTRAGQYIVDCNLFDAAERPLAWTRAKVTLDRGAQELDLEFFGKVLVDQQARGRFHIGQLRGARFDAGRDPDLEQMPPFTGTFVTAAYEPSQFSAADYDSEHKRSMVQFLVEQRDRGVHRGAAGTAPPTAPAPSDDK